jgi:cytochrome c oxidase subunit 1/cytochrome c oxidase subunit I+III
MSAPAEPERDATPPRPLALSRVPEIGRVTPGGPTQLRLQKIWESEPGWRGWLSTVDHKSIGLRYIVTAFVFLLMGGVEALIMRLQLARPCSRRNSTTSFSRCTA